MLQLENMIEYLSQNGVIVQQLTTERNYWFVRTDGGNYFDAYISGGFIGLGWNEIAFTEPDDKGNYPEEVLKFVEELGHKQPTRVLNQIKRFYKEMKAGDVVVIPSTSSLNLAFGYIADDTVYEEKNLTSDDIENGACPYVRRRHIDWITNIDKARIDPHLYALFRNHQVISDGNNYSEYINRVLHTFYIKDNIAHLVFTVEAKTNPDAVSIPNFILGLIDRADCLNQESPFLDSDIYLEDEINTRINVQSPGVIEFIGNPVCVAALAIISVALFGGKAKFEHTKEKTSGEISTEGLAGLIMKVLTFYAKQKDNNNNRIKKSKQKLDIKDITDDK